MIIEIDMGHTLNSANYGAIGIKNESEETRKVGKRLINYLEYMGHSVTNVTVDYSRSKDESLQEKVELVNDAPPDLFVSIHFNAFDGKRNGSEIYTYGGRKSPQAERILNNLESLGFKNNGILDGSQLYLIRRTKAPAILVEIAYIDNEDDMKLYDPDKVARAIAEGIIGQSISAEWLANPLSGAYRLSVSDKLGYGDITRLKDTIEDMGYNVLIHST